MIEDGIPCWEKTELFSFALIDAWGRSECPGCRASQAGVIRRFAWVPPQRLVQRPQTAWHLKVRKHFTDYTSSDCILPLQVCLLNKLFYFYNMCTSSCLLCRKFVLSLQRWKDEWSRKSWFHLITLESNVLSLLLHEEVIHFESLIIVNPFVILWIKLSGKLIKLFLFFDQSQITIPTGNAI